MRDDRMSVHLLADHPRLIPAVGEMRWREWGNEPGREDLGWWVDVTAREAGRDALPVTWVAIVDEDDRPGPLGDVPVKLKIEKNRNGVAGKSINLAFYGATQRFVGV